MIQGVVNAAYEAVVRLTVQGPSGQSREIEAVIDTGYNGFLTLPQSMVAELGLVYRDRGRAILADGSEALFNIYDVTVFTRLCTLKPHDRWSRASCCTRGVGL